MELIFDLYIRFKRIIKPNLFNITSLQKMEKEAMNDQGGSIETNLRIKVCL